MAGADDRDVDEPFFTVLTDPRFLRARLTDETRREFFAGGEALVDFIWRTIQLRLAPDFAPTAILEYGCGVGRLAIPLARRAARRAGTVTAVDRSSGMLRIAAAEADRAGAANIDFQTSDELFASTRKFDLVVCYLVLQRLPQPDGLALLRRLLGRIESGGIGVFQFPYRAPANAVVATTRWLRERVPGVTSLANVLRGQDAAQPFIPTHAYAFEDVLPIFDEASVPASYLTFDEHVGASSVMMFTESPLPRAARRSVPTAARDAIDVQALIASTSIEALNAAAEEYFSSLTSWDHHLAKPFSSPDEAPWLLTHVTVLLQSLELRRGDTVLEFGAGTGWLSRFLTQMGCRAVLLDVSPTALQIARALYERVPVVGAQPDPEFLLFDGRRIPLPDASVDRIICYHAFHHAPNPAAVIAEFGRVLKPGGRAAFAEPGPTHSRAPQSQFEMRSYRVVENDVDVHEVWRIAQGVGFADLQMMVFHGLPFRASLERYEDLLRGGQTCAEWVAETRVFLRNVRNFVLVKAGSESNDSRAASGLACEIHVQHLATGAGDASSPLRFAVTVTNVGDATWLPRSAPVGGVSIGVHVFDAGGALVRTDVLETPLGKDGGAVQPGETVTVDIALPRDQSGSMTVEFDCVADRVGWFAQLGSRPARVEVPRQSDSNQ